jgi:hypothetical protein
MATANLTIYVWDKQQYAHSEDISSVWLEGLHKKISFRKIHVSADIQNGSIQKRSKTCYRLIQRDRLAKFRDVTIVLNEIIMIMLIVNIVIYWNRRLIIPNITDHICCNKICEWTTQITQSSAWNNNSQQWYQEIIIKNDMQDRKWNRLGAKIKYMSV